MGAQAAVVEVLTAEVHVLMVGNRQVTLSVFRQLDWVDNDAIEPFGRVRDPRSKTRHYVAVVGRRLDGGSLVRSGVESDPLDIGKYERWVGDANYRERLGVSLERAEQYLDEVVGDWAVHAMWSTLPHIVLAELT